MFPLSIVALAVAVSAQRFSASSDVGATTSAVFPPNVTATFDASSAFPPGDVVGFPGPTPTGDEAAAIETAPFAAQVSAFFPLLAPETEDHAKNADVPHMWGNLAPWFSVDSKEYDLPNASPQIPKGCELESAYLWHRHGARYPTSGSGPADFATKLHGIVGNGTGFTATRDLSFLNSWTYKLGAELLTPFGREQLFDLGIGFRVKYGALLKDFTSALPVFRTTSEDRMLHSALNFAAGFFGVPMYQTDYNQVITIENPGINNTLAPYETCVNSNLPIANFGNNASALWIAKYIQPTVERLQPMIQGVNLTVTDVFSMQQLCAYETVALGYSAFCPLFTLDEWKSFSYANDLSFYYSNGPGSPVTSAMGIGLVQQFIARLTQTPFQDKDFTTTLNKTLDASNVTFPLDQKLYVDATHDTIISAFIVALNLTFFDNVGALPVDHIPANHTWIVNHIAPFGTNIVGQVLSCPSNATSTNNGTSGTHVRLILNDGVVPLAGSLKGCQPSPDGLCEFDTFVSALQERVEEIDWAHDCLANYTIADPFSVKGGVPPKQ